MADLANATKFYINGEWVEPLGSDRLDVLNPATEQVINQIAMGNAADADRAVKAAAHAFESYSLTTKEERIDLLERIIASYKKFLPAMAEAISDEMGAPMPLSNAAQLASHRADMETQFNSAIAGLISSTVSHKELSQLLSRLADRIKQL